MARARDPLPARCCYWPAWLPAIVPAPPAGPVHPFPEPAADKKKAPRFLAAIENETPTYHCPCVAEGFARRLFSRSDQTTDRRWIGRYNPPPSHPPGLKPARPQTPFG